MKAIIYSRKWIKCSHYNETTSEVLSEVKLRKDIVVLVEAFLKFFKRRCKNLINDKNSSEKYFINIILLKVKIKTKHKKIFL